MKKVFMLLIVFLATITSAQNLSNSIYLGLGNGPNVGGLLGIGAEIMFNDHWTGTFAIGSIHSLTDEDFEESKFDFDIGLKMYPLEYLYVGINYGYIDYEVTEKLRSDGFRVRKLEKKRGVSFLIGGRTPRFSNFYLSAYLGITGVGEANHFDVMGDSGFYPRIGIVLGYCL